MLGCLLRIDPHTHGIVAGTEDLHLADTGDTGKPVLDVQRRIVTQIGDVMAVPVGDEVDDHDEVGRALDRGNAERANFRRQARFGLRHSVLHELLCLIGVGTELEGDGDVQGAVRRRLA